jgi:hypothetical protein
MCASKTFFFEKKNQKTFMSCGCRTMPAGSRIAQPAQELKVFWFFSSEKNMLSLTA